MCLGGGDGGAGAERARQAQAEQERKQAIARINSTFDDPTQQAMRTAFGEDVYALNKEKLDDEHEDQARQRRFQLARQGLSGGSQDAYTRGELAENYQEGLLGVQRHADEKVLDLRAADERARSNLVSQANSGLDAATAAQLALNSASTNLESAQSQDIYADLGQFMKALSLGKEQHSTAEGRRRARALYDDDPYSIFAPGAGGGGTQTSIGPGR